MMGELATLRGGESFCRTAQLFREVQVRMGAGRLILGGRLMLTWEVWFVAGGKTGYVTTGLAGTTTALVTVISDGGGPVSSRGVVAQPASSSNSVAPKINSADLSTRQLCGRDGGTQVDSGGFPIFSGGGARLACSPGLFAAELCGMMGR